MRETGRAAEEGRVAPAVAERDGAAEKLDALCAVAALLPRLTQPRSVCRAMVRSALRALGACGGTVALASEVGTLELACALGYPRSFTESWRRFALAVRAPCAETVLSRAAAWLESREAIARRHPELAALPRPFACERWASVPLVAGGKAIGALGLGFPDSRPFTPEERSFAQALAALGAQALDRARLRADSEDAHADRDDVARRLARAQDRLRQRDRLLERAIQAAPAGIALFDGATLRLRWANALYRRFVREDLRGPIDGLTAAEIIPGAEERGVLEIFRRCAAGGTPHLEPEFEHAHPRYGSTWWRWSVVTLTERGPPHDLLVMMVDVTDQVVARRAAEGVTAGAVAALDARRELHEDVERRNAELEAILAAIADGLVIYDARGGITRMNEAAQQLLGYSEADRRRPLEARMRLTSLRTPDGRPYPVGETPAARALAGLVTRGAVMVMGEGAAKRWLSSSGAPIRASGGPVLGAVATFSDVSEIHRAHEHRDDLMRTLSHDVRTPLMVILNQAELLRRRAVDPATARAADGIAGSARQIGTMIGDLVEAFRLEAGQLSVKLGDVDVHALAAEVIERLRGTLPVERVRLEVAPGVPPARADPDRLERVLVNLLSNALKYSATQSEVSVAVACAPDGRVELAVRDRGPGLADEDLPYLFERFYRARAARSVEGLGLGLYIARMLVEAQGGSITAANRAGGGAELRVALPASGHARE